MPYNRESHAAARGFLRLAGAAVTLAGAIFMLVGFIDFFQAFGSPEPPRRFWCFFAGMPLLFVGLNLLGAGFMGAVARYAAREQIPVVQESAPELAEPARQLAAAVAAGAREGLRTAPASAARLRCAKCGEGNDSDARFCKSCGDPLAGPRTCVSCGASNDPDARFCDACGKPV